MSTHGGDDLVLATDMFRAYQKIATEVNIHHIRIQTGKHTHSAFNIHMINNDHQRLKELMIGRFKDVATTYPNNYLIYHNFTNYANGYTPSKELELFEFIRDTSYISRTQDIPTRPAIPL